MNMSQDVLFLASLIALVIVGPLIGVLFLVFRSYKGLVVRFATLEIENKKMRDDAQKESEKIVSTARSQAAMIISKAQEINSGVTKEFSESLNRAQQEYLKQYQEALKRMSADMQASSKVGFDKVAKSVNVEIDKYKRSRMAAIDQDVIALADKFAKKYLGRALSQEEHQRLVVKALEQAKKENVL